MSKSKAPSTKSATRAQRVAEGRAARARVPRDLHGAWEPVKDRPDPVGLLAAQETARVPELLPLRHERMAASPFAFYRGAATIFAADVAPGPDTGIRVQLCGDAHLANFGAFASPERSLVFDLNDFDETLPGPFEWDLKRLAASFEIAGRANSLGPDHRTRAVTGTVRSYCQAMQQFAEMSYLDIWYSRLTATDIADRWAGEATRGLLKRFRKTVDKAESKDRLKALGSLTDTEGGEPRFRSDPPVLVRAAEVFTKEEERVLFRFVDDALHSYHESLQRDRRHLVERYRLVDLARKVVGVGSVGTRCWVALLVGHDDQDPLFLQIKEAEPSVLEPYLGASSFPQHGQRVVEGQRIVQATPDILLGWAQVQGRDSRHDYYFRQLWDWKGSAPIERMNERHLSIYGQVCGYTLARAHARSGSAINISAYLGSGTHMAGALAAFASAYADQNEADHASFSAWIAAGCPPLQG